VTALVMIVLGGVLLVVPSSRWRLTERRWVLPALPIPSRRRTASASVVEVLAGLVGAAEQSAKLRREVAAQLAGPRGTVRVLAVLPAVGVGMGLLMGADPIGFLLGTPWGLGCLIIAIALEAAGIVWMRRLVSSIERQL
jgi:hypothetical protein